MRAVSKKTAVDLARQALGKRLDRRRGDAHHLEAGLGEACHLAAQGVELTIGRDQARFRCQWQRREPADDEFVGACAEGDLAAGIVEQRPESLAHALGLREGEVAVLVHRARGVVERCEDTLSRHIPAAPQ